MNKLVLGIWQQTTQLHDRETGGLLHLTQTSARACRSGTHRAVSSLQGKRLELEDAELAGVSVSKMLKKKTLCREQAPEIRIGPTESLVQCQPSHTQSKLQRSRRKD